MLHFGHFGLKLAQTPSASFVMCSRGPALRLPSSLSPPATSRRNGPPAASTLINRQTPNIVRRCLSVSRRPVETLYTFLDAHATFRGTVTLRWIAGCCGICLLQPTYVDLALVALIPMTSNCASLISVCCFMAANLGPSLSSQADRLVVLALCASGEFRLRKALVLQGCKQKFYFYRKPR